MGKNQDQIQVQKLQNCQIQIQPLCLHYLIRELMKLPRVPQLLLLLLNTQLRQP